MSQTLSASLNVEQIVRQLLTAAADMTAAEGSSVWLWADETRTWLTCKACYIRGEYFANVNLSLPATQGLVGWVATNAQAMQVQDVAGNAAGYPETNVYAYLVSRSLLAVPLLARDATIGVLELSNLPDDVSSDEHKSLVET